MNFVGSWHVDFGCVAQSWRSAFFLWCELKTVIVTRATRGQETYRGRAGLLITSPHIFHLPPISTRFQNGCRCSPVRRRQRRQVSLSGRKLLARAWPAVWEAGKIPFFSGGSGEATGNRAHRWFSRGDLRVRGFAVAGYIVLCDRARRVEREAV